jgi:hypothetical protein
MRPQEASTDGAAQSDLNRTASSKYLFRSLEQLRFGADDPGGHIIQCGIDATPQDVQSSTDNGIRSGLFHIAILVYQS